MKKCFAFLLSFSIFFLSGCVQKDLIDIYVFSDRFSHLSENFVIDTEEFASTEQGDNLAFPITFNKKFLLTVRVNKKTSLLTSVSVVYVFEKKYTISDKDFSTLCELIECSTKAFTNFAECDEIHFEKKLLTQENQHKHFEKGFYDFSLITDENGIYFSVSTDRR